MMLSEVRVREILIIYLVCVLYENMNFLCVYVYFCIYFGLIIIRLRLFLKKIILLNLKEG